MLSRLSVVRSGSAVVALHTSRRCFFRPSPVRRDVNPLSAEPLRVHRDNTLVPLLKAKKAKLAAMLEIKRRCDASTDKLGDRYMLGIYLFLVLQCIVLFDWTYIHFDWTLTEPITYLVGYSATWIGLWWYGNMQREFSFDNFRMYVTARRREKLYKANNFDMNVCQQLAQDVQQLEARVRSLRTL